LYSYYINNNIKYLSKNYNTANMVSTWKKKSSHEKKKLLDIASRYLNLYK